MSLGRSDAGASRITLLTTCPRVAQEHQRVPQKVLHRDADHVPGVDQPRVRVADVPLALEPAITQPRVRLPEADAAVIGLGDLDLVGFTVDLDDTGMRDGVGDLGERLCQISASSRVQTRQPPPSAHIPGSIELSSQRQLAASARAKARGQLAEPGHSRYWIRRMTSEAETGRVPPASGVIVRAGLFPAGFRTVSTEKADVVLSSTRLEICDVPVARPATVSTCSITPAPLSSPRTSCPASVTLTCQEMS